MRIITILMVALLTGCSMLKEKQFDSFEYNHSVNTTVSATQAISLCGNKERTDEFNRLTGQLTTNILTLSEHMKHRESNEVDLSIINDIKILVVALNKKQDMSPRYCVHKLSEVQAATRTLSRALGRLNDMNICDSSVSSRGTLYTTSRKNELITDEELTELTNDLTILKRIDDASCSVENKIKFDNIFNGVKAVFGALGGL